MRTSPSLFAWFISAVLASIAVAMNYLGSEMPLGSRLEAAGSPLELLLAAYLILWASAAVRSVRI